jgi:hypothetical protein
MQYRQKTYFLLIIGFFSLFALMGCGKDSSVEQAALTSNSLTYDMNQNGCDTGRQSFADLPSYCTGLENNTLNHFCASSLRQQEYVARGCPGTYTPF